MKSVFIILCLLLSSVNSLPTGAPEAACATMSPDMNAHGAAPQTTPSPYKIKAKLKDGHYEVVLSGETFKGFALRAQDSQGNPLKGNFEGEEEDVQIVSCKNGFDLITHRNPLDKEQIKFTFTPENSTEDVIFYGAVVQSVSVYWTNIESS